MIKTVSDSAAGLRCLSRMGLEILTPYTKRLGVTKNTFAVMAGLLEITWRVHDPWELSHEQVKSRLSPDRLNARWWKNVCMITVSTFSVLLNFFGALDSLFGEFMDPKDRMPRAIFNFWGTNASLAALGYAAIDYYCDPAK